MEKRENYRAAVYMRLSKEDGEKNESESIANQRDLIKNFVSSREDIVIHSEKIDDGYSGVTFNRPAFNDMMEEIKTGKINCVIVKDLSRFGRNYIEAGRYIEQIFPRYEVRFIAVNDNIDTIERSLSDSLLVPFKNFINDIYCEDISVKTRTQLEIKRRSGNFTGAFPSYGYLKSAEDKHKLVVDAHAANVVREIFELKISGMNEKNIAGTLNERGEATPLDYKKSIGLGQTSGFKVYERSHWTSQTVRRILTNEIYCGHLVQGKRSTLSYKIKKIINVPEESWTRVENTHPAIISKFDFDTVQRLMKQDTRTSPGKKNVHMFSGLLKCASCGENMVRRSVGVHGKRYDYYICSSYKRSKGCTPHTVREDVVYEVLLKVLRSHINRICNDPKTLKGSDPEFFSILEKYRNIKSLTRSAVAQLVYRIEIEDENNVNVKMKCE